MTTRSTSRETYDHLVKTGQLVGKQAEVMDALTKTGPATSGEVLDSMGIRNVNAWRARFTELAGRGLIVEQGTRRCRISGRTCVVWAPTTRRAPLSIKGAKAVSAGAWRKIAAALVAEIEAGLNVSHPHMAAVLERYRKLGGAS